MGTEAGAAHQGGGMTPGQRALAWREGMPWREGWACVGGGLGMRGGRAGHALCHSHCEAGSTTKRRCERNC